MGSNVFIVYGESGSSFSDCGTWAVRAFPLREEAESFKIACQALATLARQGVETYAWLSEVPNHALDPQARGFLQFASVSYYVESLPFGAPQSAELPVVVPNAPISEDSEV